MEKVIGGKQPIVKATGEVSPVEFPALTKEDLEEIRSLFIKLCNVFLTQGGIPGFQVYTGTGKNVGQGNEYINSEITISQFIFSIAMTRHPLIKEMAKHGFNKEKFNAKVLVEQQIMARMKILDLGCGSMPVFARCCRAMGADVWTVDKKPANFIFDENLFTQKQRDLEIQKHIQLDLLDPQATDIIMQRSSGNFNLVTEGNLNAEMYLGEELPQALLRVGGVHHEPADSVEFLLKQ